MKRTTYHAMRDDDRSHRLCDGKPLTLPLPHHEDDVEPCPECEAKMEAADAGTFGIGLSFAKR